MTGTIFKLILLSFFHFYLFLNTLKAHEGHNHKQKMPAIGIVQGSVTDSVTSQPIEYASISVIDNNSGTVVTGGLSKKDGSYRVGKFDFKYRKTWKQTDGTMYKRKGKARTTKREDYLLAHDLEKKAPRNISYQRLLWISVGKKIWGVSQFRLSDEHIRLYVLNPTKYSQLKNLLRGNLDGSTMQ